MYNYTYVKDFSMSLVYLKNKKSNVTYVYECVSFWNKEKKRPDSNRTCIGKLDPITGELVRSKKQEIVLTPAFATIKTIGATSLFDYICLKTNLKSILKKSFPETW